ncbi:hypothetical protein MBT84_37910 [Streptomyces sp. MBT84]|nr:hypothetical protein [Streptomyces sp. MBT84]
MHELGEFCQRHPQVAEAAYELCGRHLARRVVAVPGVRVHPGRYQQPDFLIATQGLHGQQGHPREVPDGQQLVDVRKADLSLAGRVQRHPNPDGGWPVRPYTSDSQDRVCWSVRSAWNHRTRVAVATACRVVPARTSTTSSGVAAVYASPSSVVPVLPGLRRPGGGRSARHASGVARVSTTGQPATLPHRRLRHRQVPPAESAPASGPIPPTAAGFAVGGGADFELGVESSGRAGSGACGTSGRPLGTHRVTAFTIVDGHRLTPTVKVPKLVGGAGEGSGS